MKNKWSWALPDLVDIVKKVAEDAKELGHVEDAQEIVKKVFQPWNTKKSLDYWQGKYPLLNVEDLHDEITQAISEVYA